MYIIEDRNEATIYVCKNLKILNDFIQNFNNEAFRNRNFEESMVEGDFSIFYINYNDIENSDTFFEPDRYSENLEDNFEVEIKLVKDKTN